MNASHHQIGGQQQGPTPRVDDQRGIIADPDLAGRGTPSCCCLKLRLQGGNYVKFTCMGSADIPVGFASSGVSAGTNASTTGSTWIGSNHASCLAFNPFPTVYY